MSILSNGADSYLTWACFYWRSGASPTAFDGPGERVSDASHSGGGKLGLGEHGSPERALSVWVETEDDSIVRQRKVAHEAGLSLSPAQKPMPEGRGAKYRYGTHTPTYPCFARHHARSG